jgi:NAD(P)-dependent dehydrogenase (short-subunit alcohol dehydrogenase family)
MDARWSLQGKRAVVTGGTKGIGRATADTLLDLGASVLVVARDPQGVEATRAECGHRSAGSPRRPTYSLTTM